MQAGMRGKNNTFRTKDNRFGSCSKLSYVCIPFPLTIFGAVKKISVFCLGLIAVFFTSCKNDLDVIDEYKETMVVYGLLNPADTAQYFRITKAFLGRTSAYDMAGVFDSSNYAVGQITAKLEQWKNGLLIQSIPLYRDTVIPKDAGVFSYPSQVLYKTTVPILQDGSDYKLYVTNNTSEVNVTAGTPIVQQIPVTIPILNSTINLVGQAAYKAKWKTAANGRLYNLVLRFHYQERFVFDTLQIADKYIDINFATFRSATLSGSEPLEQEILQDNFFRSIKNDPGMTVDPMKERFFKSLEFRFSSAAEDFATYMDVSNTTGSTFGDHPFYTNITGGIGLFSSRYTYAVTNIGLNNLTKDSLRNGRFTYDLGFQ